MSPKQASVDLTEAVERARRRKPVRGTAPGSSVEEAPSRKGEGEFDRTQWLAEDTGADLHSICPCDREGRRIRALFSTQSVLAKTVKNKEAKE